MRCLKLPATPANHARALRRASFQLESAISNPEKQVIDRAITDYSRGSVRLSVPVGLLKEQIGSGASWLGGQSYFDPSPPEVLLDQIGG
jgi:uncharacterized protein YbgA (DUF1722 family)